MLPHALLATGVLLALAGCTVYAPMQPTTPLLRQRGQAEVGASLQATGRLEITGAYSPVRRVVLTGGLTGAPRLGKQQFLVTRQYEAGAGLYQPLGQRWLLSGLGGFGQAYCHRGYVDLGILGPGACNEYEAVYHKYFGQVGVAHRRGAGPTYSLTYRLTSVRFDYLTDSRLGPLPLPGMLRHELAVAVRGRLAANARWQVAGTGGVSVASTARLNDNSGYPEYGAPAYQANRNLLPAFFGSVGVVHYFGAGQL